MASVRPVEPAPDAATAQRSRAERSSSVVSWDGWSLLATACLLWPGLGTADPDASLPAGFHGQRLEFELLVLAPLTAVVAVGTVFHLTSRRSPRRPRARARTR